MHVALLIDSLASGGAQRQLVELACRLPAAVRRSVLVYHEEDFFGHRLREAGIEVVLLPKRRKLDPAFVAGLRRWCARERPDVLHAWMLAPSLWSVLALRTLRAGRRPRLVAGVRDSVVVTDPTQAFLQRVLNRSADAVTANSRRVREELLRRSGLPDSRVVHIPNGIDLARWDAEAREPSEIALSSGGLRLAMVGGLRREKGHAVLFRALQILGRERIRGWTVSCVGGRTGSDRSAEEIEAEAGSLGLRDVVRLHPPVRRVAAVLSGVDALVLPSHHEAFPNAVLEAMASRLPVLASAVGDVPDLVEDGRTGFLVPPGDPEALAAALLRLAELAPASRAQMGEGARARVEQRFAMERVAEGHLRLYASLVERASEAAGHAAVDGLG